MKSRERLGGILALLGGVLGIVGTFLIFLNWYQAGMSAEAAEPGCEILLKYLMPGLGDVALLAGVLYLVSGYLFFTGSKWAFRLVVIANVLALQGSFFINVPFMAAGLPPIYFAIFFPNLLLYFLLTRLVGRLCWRRILLGLVAGLAFVFCFMNGVASLSRIITIGAPLFSFVQRAHWFAMVGMGFLTVQTLLRPTEWSRIVGLAAAVMELVVGIPLAFATAVQLERFSLFSLAPIFSALLLVVLLWPSLWRRLSCFDEGRPDILGA
jgi:hypothetical protein